MTSRLGAGERSQSDDYTTADLRFKVRKVARYFSLFGFSRTIMKIKGQYHMKATGSFDGARWHNPGCKSADAPDRQVALIGCGLYAFSNIAYYLGKERPKFLRCAYDPHQGRAMSLCKAYGGAYVPADWRDMLADSRVEIVFIASNHASHAEYAIACIDAGKHVHIEKPHVVSQDQLGRLTAAVKRNPGAKIYLGFNRPKSTLFKHLRALLVKESGPIMINWFVAGHSIPRGHWYFDEKEGGRVLGNLCHWTDLTLHMVTLEKSFPCTIVPATPPGSDSDFVVSAMFADRSCVAITFSAKGHSFEGVREVLNVHKGDLLANITDFHSLTVDIREKKTVRRLRHHDHGHGVNLVHSLSGVGDRGVPGEDLIYIVATAKFFLAVRTAIDTGQPVVLSWDEITRVAD